MKKVVLIIEWLTKNQTKGNDVAPYISSEGNNNTRCHSMR